MKAALIKQLCNHYASSSGKLLNNRMWGASYHLAGISIELALKACMSKKFHRNEIPDKGFMKDVYIHDLNVLLKQAGLADILYNQSNNVILINWSVVKDWRIESRYTRIEEVRSVAMYAAAFNKDEGVLQWIKTYW